MNTESQWRLAWEDRPPEEAANLNPAFCSELIGCTVSEYHKARAIPMNFAVAFLILPLTLHGTTQQVLPRRANVAFAGWIADNNPLLAELPGRVNHLRPITREALLFSVKHKLLAFKGGGLVPGAHPIALSAKRSVTTDDADGVRRAARMLGRWFANQGSQLLILQGMGVAP